MKESIVKAHERLSALTDRQLFAAIAGDLAASTFNAAPVPESEREQEGEKWWLANISWIRLRICKSSIVQVIREKKEGWESTLTFAAFSDLVASQTLGVSPMTCAMLISRYGIQRLCDEQVDPR
jgi:hypothetical protein